MAQRRDYYEVLGVSRYADQDEIRRAFHAGALKYHPDRYRGSKGYAARKFRELMEAYRFLSDPGRRRGYDSRLHRRDARNRGLSPQELWEMGFARWSAAGAGAGGTRPGGFPADMALPKESPKAYASLVLAIVATWCYPLVVPAVVCGVAALVLGVWAKRDVARGRGTSYSQEMSLAGRIIGALAVLFALVTLYVWARFEILPWMSA